MSPLPLVFPSSSVFHLCSLGGLKVPRKSILASTLKGMKTISTGIGKCWVLWVVPWETGSSTNPAVLMDRGFLIPSISSAQCQSPDKTPLSPSVFHISLCCHHLITLGSPLWLKEKVSCHLRSKSMWCTVTWVQTFIPVWLAMALPVLSRPRSLPSYKSPLFQGDWSFQENRPHLWCYRPGIFHSWQSTEKTF